MVLGKAATTISVAPVIDTDKLAVKTDVYVAHMGLRLGRWFKSTAKDVGEAVSKFKGMPKVIKADGSDDDEDHPLDDEDLEREILAGGAELTPIQRNTVRALALLAWGQIKWEVLPDKLTRYFSGSAAEGVDLGVAQVMHAANQEDTGFTVDDIPPAKTLEDDALTEVQEFVANRSAELAGMKRGKDGKTLEPNADAEWALTDATRKDLVNTITQAVKESWTPKQLAAVLEASYSWSTARAELVARTELARAQSFGNYITWHLTGLAVYVQWETSEDEGVCDICDGFEAQGVVRLGHEFAPGIKYPIAHPRCRCALKVVPKPEDDD
jgi:hypothetical protein